MKKNSIFSRMFSPTVKEVRAENEESSELWVEGYAVVFNFPTVLFEMDGNEYREQIDGNAFAECDMSDVIFNYNHGGKVIARTRNSTLELKIDEKGLFIRAKLDGTEEGRRLYDEISKGYIDKMSFQFSISSEAYDNTERMWTVHKIKRLYDVSAVDIPAYDDTSIVASRKQEINNNLENEKNLIMLKLKL